MQGRQFLKEISDFTRELALESANHGAVTSLTRIAMERLCCPVIVIRPSGSVLSWQIPGEYPLAAAARLTIPTAVKETDSFPATGITTVSGQSLPFYLWAVGENNPLAYLLLVKKKEEFSELELALAEQLKWAIYLTIFDQKKHEEQERRYRDNFLQDVLFNNIDGIDGLLAKGREWGLDFNKPQVLLVMESETFANNIQAGWHSLRSEVELFLKGRHPHSAVTSRGDQLVIFLPFGREEADGWKTKVKKLLAELKQYLDEGKTESKFTAGCGKFYADVRELYRCFQEAKTALELGRLFKTRQEVTFFDEIGAVRLFYNQNEQELDDFFEEVLGPVVKYDRENGSDLLENMCQYFACNGDLAKAADKLFIHRNTLRYRLQKTEEILDVNLTEQETRFNIYAAIKVGLLRELL